MKIGNQHFDLKNMSKNQRKLLKAIKEKYEEALAEGVDLGDDIFGSFQIEGKIKSADVERVKASKASEFYQYNPRQRDDTINQLQKQDDNEEYYRIRVESFLSNFTPYPYTRRGRRRKFSSGEQAMMGINRIFTNAMNQYPYKVLSAVIDSIPRDIMHKINANNVYERYDGIMGAFTFLSSLDFSQIQYMLDMDMMSAQEEAEDYEDYGDEE